MFTHEMIKSFNQLEMDVYNYIISNEEKVVYMNSVPFYFFSLFHSSDYSLNNWLASFQHCRPAARMEHG